MTALDLSSPVAVVGTGTMGQGIAQVALVAGHTVRLYDTVPGRAREAAAAIGAAIGSVLKSSQLSVWDARSVRDMTGRSSSSTRLRAAWASSDAACPLRNSVSSR